MCFGATNRVAWMQLQTCHSPFWLVYCLLCDDYESRRFHVFIMKGDLIVVLFWDKTLCVTPRRCGRVDDLGLSNHIILVAMKQMILLIYGISRRIFARMRYTLLYILLLLLLRNIWFCLIMTRTLFILNIWFCWYWFLMQILIIISMYVLDLFILLIA